MSTQEDEFRNALRATFKVEAAEHLQAIATGLLALEKTPAPEGQRDLIATVFRAAHSLKGAARAVDFTEIESRCQSMEDQFASWKRRESPPSPATFDTAHHNLDAIAGALAAPEAPEGAPVPAAEALAAIPPQPAEPMDLLRPIPETMHAAPAAAQNTCSSADTVRITVAKLETRLVAAEEMLTAKLSTGQRADELRELACPLAAWRNEWEAVEPDAQDLRRTVERPPPGHAPSPGLARLLAFFDRNLDYLKALEVRVAAVTRAAAHDSLIIGKLVDDLLEDSKKLLLLPFATVAAPFPKLVHDLCRDLGKEAQLVICGEKIELDKRILDEMKDPLIHLLRNCVDHGIEAPERRIRADKPACGTITITVSQVNSSKVEILVSDDGAGINTETVKQSAVKHGLLSATDACRLDDAAARDLAFQAEVSTSPLITRLSGRGLGLAIVREKATKLGGTVAVESQPGRGTRFRIVLPSLLATFRGVLIEAAGRSFIVPTAQIERVVRVKASEVQTVEGCETIAVGGCAVALVGLADVLALPRADATGDAAPPALVLGTGNQRVAFAVDAVLDELEVLVKPLRKPLSRVRNIAGTTVLGSGQLTPILNVADLLKSVRKNSARGGLRAAAAKTPEVRPRSLLVVEDSITSRTLLKGILEAAGYNVKTAVDGMEAFALLRAKPFDLVVSDVEMPRLNGFDLTARIRADRKLAELPVVLVTALENRADRERGMDVGASAYLVKSSFDQSNLLDTVRMLI